ncbi:MAG: hypothetical protein ACP5RX_00980 [Minisyncoccia bacterium]
MSKTFKLSILAIILVAGFALFNISSAKALTIADQNGIPSSCPNKYPNNTQHCTVFIDSITVNGFVDNDTSYIARTTPVPYGYLIPGQTINISWTDNSGANVNNYIVKYGCGNSINLDNDDYVISTPVWPKSTTWTVPSLVSNYQYCKIWVYAKGITPNNQPTLGVSNTRAFTIQAPVTRYTCNSNYQCVVDVNGAYPSLTSCQNACVAPTVRYSCNTTTYQCYQAVFGTYASYNDCISNCQPNYQSLSVSCYAFPNNPQVNQTVTFYSNVTGGSEIYNYSWSGYASGNSSYIQQTFNSPGTYTAYLTVTDSNGRTGSTSCSAYVQGQTIVNPTLSFWADNYNLNQGTSTYLRWTASNASYCVASNGWSGTKATSNYEATAPNSQTTYTLTCYGVNGGQVTQSLTIYVNSPSTNLSFTKLGRNLSNGDRAYSKVIRVAQGDVVEFYLTVAAGSYNDLQNVVVTDPLPSAFSYMSGTTKVNGVIQADGISTTGLSLGTIPRGTSKTILFQAQSNNPGTNLTYTNTAQVTASGISALTDSATITYGLVAGASTVATGAEDSLLISLIISLGLALLIWYYLKFNPQGKLAFAKLENKIRDFRLEYTKRQLMKK